MRKSLSELIFLKNRTFARNETMSRQQLEAQQLRKFRRLVAYVQKHSPYYADLIASRSIDIYTCRLEDFPVLTKSAVMANFDRIITDRRLSKHMLTEFLKQSKDPAELYLDEYYVVHTSGSPGRRSYGSHHSINISICLRLKSIVLCLPLSNNSMHFNRAH
jgi:phenylacetate-CoA ligase